MGAVGGHPILVDRHSFLPAQFAFTFHRRALLVTAWLMIAALAAARTTQLWLFAALAAATAVWLVVKAGTETANTLPWIFCSNSNSEAATPRPRSVVKNLRSEPLVTARGKHVTAQLVHLPPRAFSPRMCTAAT